MKHDDFDTFRFFCVVFKELSEGVPSKLDNAVPNASTEKSSLYSSRRGKRQPISFALRACFLGRSRERAVTESAAPLRACLFDSSVSLERR